MSTPSITPAQLFAVAKFAVAFFVAQHYVSAGQGRTALEVAAVVLPGVLIVADAVIRHGRSKIGLELAAQGWQRELRGLAHDKTVQEAAAAIWAEIQKQEATKSLESATKGTPVAPATPIVEAVPSA